MKTTTNTLPSDAKSLQKIVLDLQLKLSKQDTEIIVLKSKYQTIFEQFLLAQKKQLPLL
ncbi:hypothetical protein MNBD_GAMMA10-433 [hydrothermal vent metagenome]|uniref:Uncharacterized protein n=1 Tax=hydrothermal vent metagenome TaxID=652676 RepID=A0A3B0XT84_9ZZZZ